MTFGGGTDVALTPSIEIHTDVTHDGSQRISLCKDIAHEKKLTGLPQIWVLTLSLRNSTSTNFCRRA